MSARMTGKAAAETARAAAPRELFAATKMDGSVLPRAPESAFRKRPVRLSYDKNEFWMYRLPSENHFLLQNFDKNDLFGKRHGIDHAPQYKSQMDIDSRLLLGLVGITFAMLLSDFPRNAKMLNLR
mmetsp:Transcript_12833/g.15246  ORF Transcript_12833/g.15246 Transcript_12833/m.15246 type:complete len:126 (-) Transcript_12833:255-632(-)